VRLTLKAVAVVPLAAVTWLVDGREVGTAGPPYEITLSLGRGRHRLAVVGPDGRGDSVDVQVQ
jgi:membrane carboxypeptidase/penicillin-binding protein PbpC